MTQLIREYRTGRMWIRSMITRKDLRKGTNAMVPGYHMLTGMWYGKRLDQDCMGKISPMRGLAAGVSAPIPSPYVARQLGYAGRISTYRPREVLRSVKCPNMYMLAMQKAPPKVDPTWERAERVIIEL